MRSSQNKKKQFCCCSTKTENQEMKTNHTQAFTSPGSRWHCDGILSSLLQIKEPNTKLDLGVIDSLGKRWHRDPEIFVCYKYLKAEMTESLLGSTDE